MKDTKSRLPKIIQSVANVVEAAVAVCLIIAVVYLVIRMIFEYTALAVSGEDFSFSVFLAHAMNLIIGIEFTKMLCRHTPDTIIDVLMFATARQAILDHTRIMENLLAVVAIAILFLLRKYVLPEDGGKTADRAAPLFRVKKAIVPLGAKQETVSAETKQETDLP